MAQFLPYSVFIVGSTASDTAGEAKRIWCITALLHHKEPEHDGTSLWISWPCLSGLFEHGSSPLQCDNRRGSGRGIVFRIALFVKGRGGRYRVWSSPQHLAVSDGIGSRCGGLFCVHLWRRVLTTDAIHVTQSYHWGHNENCHEKQNA